MATFLLLDATDQAITLCWERGPDVSVVEVQMKTTPTTAQQRQQQEVKDGSEVGNEVAQSSGSGGGGLGDEGDWVTLSKSLGSSALRKKKLAPGTEYVFRRRARKQVFAHAYNFILALTARVCFLSIFAIRRPLHAWTPLPDSTLTLL